MKIGIVGLGLIGGSIFKTLERLGYSVVGISKSQNGKQANIYSEKEYLKDCDIVFVCTPMNNIINDLRSLENYLTPNTIVTDVSSLKEFVTEQNFSFNFIPSHPMAGTEFSGYENSFDGMFNGSKWVLTPKDGIVPDNLKKIIQEMGAQIIITTAKEHDCAVAQISHMPLVVAQALFMTADDKLSKKLAASGFRDMTRLAMSNEIMACDMVKMNSSNIQAALLKLYSNIGALIKENYPEKIKQIKNERSKMYVDGKNVL